MFDTIKFRLHGILDVDDTTLALIKKETKGLTNVVVPEHQELYKKLIKYRDKNFTLRQVFNRETNTVEVLDEEEFLLLENSKQFSQFYQNRNMMRFVDAKKTKDVNLRINGTYRLTSSSPDVNFSINENGSFIDFEVSVPKYLYGHNIAQFIPQVNSQRYLRFGTNLHSWNVQTKLLYQRILEFFDRFFTDLCTVFKLETMPNYEYIEIRRVDLCYNQFFNSKEDALTYLQNVKKLKKERNYKTKKQTSNYGTTYALASQFGSYFKIYHKGEEYSKTKGDLSKHMKLNKEFIDAKVKDTVSRNTFNKKFQLYKENRDLIFSTFEDYAADKPQTISQKKKEELTPLIKEIKKHLPYDVVFLKNEADKILRYEVSLYGQFFQYLYKSKCFRRNCPIHQLYYKRYKKTKSDLDSRNTGKKVFKEDLKNYKDFHRYMSRSITLLLSDKKIRKHIRSGANDMHPVYVTYNISRNIYKNTRLRDMDLGHFSDYFLKKCVKHFYELVQKHQIKEIDTFEDIASKIAEYNNRVEERILQYNSINAYKIRDSRGELKIRGNKVITKATQLLKESEKRNLKLKKVNANLLLFLVDKIKNGQSLEQYRKDAKLPSSTFHRYKKDLEMFGVFENSLETKTVIDVDTTFKDYYWKTDTLNYQQRFFNNDNQIRYE